jgi:hypothetical protein
LYFTITKWTEINNTDDSSKADYPNGYKLEGSVNETGLSNDGKNNWKVSDWNTVGGTTPMYVFMYKDGSKIKWGSSSTPGGEYIKQK